MFPLELMSTGRSELFRTLACRTAGRGRGNNICSGGRVKVSAGYGPLMAVTCRRNNSMEPWSAGILMRAK